MRLCSYYLFLPVSLSSVRLKKIFDVVLLVTGLRMHVRSFL